MKHLILFEGYNPDRISDEKYKIYSDKLEITNGGLIDKKDHNLFYISDVFSKMPHEVDNPEVTIVFYSPSLDLFGQKILTVTFVIDYEQYLYTTNPNLRLLSLYAYAGGKLVDVYFSKYSLDQIIKFLKDDFPESYKIINGITHESVLKVQRSLLRRI